MHERRQTPRWYISRQTKIKLQGAQAFATCMLKDINFKGARISLGMKLPKDTFLKLSIVLSDEFRLDVEVWVVWYKNIEGFNVYGIYFSKINELDKERLYKFMRINFPEHMNIQCWKGSIPQKGDEEMEDHRIFARLTAKLILRYLELSSGKEGWGKTEDVSAKGMGLITNEEISPQTPIEIWIEIADKEVPLYTRGEVVWLKKLESNKFRLGVKLEKADLIGLGQVLTQILQ